MKNNVHNFHIPVMGTAFTIDTPVKVAKYGISSVISIVDDVLIEKMRKFYSEKQNIPFEPITNKIEDFRAKRITAYLNLVDEVVKEKFEEVKKSFAEKSTEIEKYMEMLPNFSELKKEFDEVVKNNIKDAQKWLQENLSVGSIDVNIMTKLDKENYIKKEKLPSEYNDAHAALRGFANSTLNSAVVLSAGMNPRLYSYFSQFDDFYPSAEGLLNKKIILKVSDYRSAIIQGKFMAKKGLWISEYRIESGLNCGGHAFATDGFLMGPILEEFKENRQTLIDTTHEILAKALESAGRPVPKKPLEIKITAQGGVGTAEEHQFLIDHYGVDSVGWGTPFLLVPEATTVAKGTQQMLADAEEKDLYRSGISPLGVPFNTLRGNTKDLEKMKLVIKNRPGSSCPKKYLVSNKEFTENTICTASRQYQFLKIKQLEEEQLPENEYQKALDRIHVKSCLCVGLSTSADLVHNLETKESDGVSVCPGPNLAYFSDIVSLKEMAQHIYGKINIMKRADRPNMFIKELGLYVDYLKDKIDEMQKPIEGKQQKYLNAFYKNMNEGITYYKELYSKMKSQVSDIQSNFLEQLENFEKELIQIEQSTMVEA